ncbi:hypothetical protein SLEP1_g21493 [Rubroshorea leprosula]|uniref:glutathione transferase n=1 Tax=Rubroshorea leprosula TaxID=152421 RepID=A0AAV5J635_9ROSI|nr:hypothetical protein SLEP1_g21493 [Rubroshorea leprosula]
MAEEVKLFGTCGSPFSSRIQVALKLKGISYEYIEEDLASKSPLLLKYNPIHKKVPVLLHNGKPIVESLVILEYIDETWKANPILPEDPYDRATARFWAKYIDEKCVAAAVKAFWAEEKEREKAVEEACECLKTLEGALKDKKFAGGETLGLVDIAASFIAFWLRSFQEISGVEMLTEEKFPNLFKWSEEYVEDPIIKEYLPSRDELIVFVNKRLQNLK